MLDRADAVAGDGGDFRHSAPGAGEIINCSYGVLAVRGANTTLNGMVITNSGTLRTGSGTATAENDVYVEGGTLLIENLARTAGTIKLYAAAGGTITHKGLSTYSSSGAGTVAADTAFMPSLGADDQRRNAPGVRAPTFTINSGRLVVRDKQVRGTLDTGARYVLDFSAEQA